MDTARASVFVERTTFVGRAADLDGLGRRFAEGARLVSILGTAGMGKTRLARRFAAAWREAQRGDGWFCDLTEARDEEAICTAVAGALGVTLAPGRAGAEQVGRALQGRGPALLVLDNFEQLVEHGPATVGRWLAATKETHFLVTSRERLRLEGEVAQDLSPLDPESAVKLFVERARALRPGFAPAGADAAVVEALVLRLDGIPLAIELAAARSGVLGPAQILERLQRSFDLLSAGGRDRSPRQSTLRGAIDWSWELLEPWERAALAQCAVFRGGFDLPAAEAAIDVSAFSEAPPALDVVQGLRDKSLLHAYPPAEFPDELRFGMFESIREFAAEKLADGEFGPGARKRHAAYFLRAGFAWEQSVLLRGALDDERRLHTERDNLIAVLERALAVSPSTAESVAQAAGALTALHETLPHRGSFDAQGPWLDAALAAADEAAAPALLVAGLLEQRGTVHLRRGRTDQAAADLTRAARLAAEFGDRFLEARAKTSLGILYRRMGRPARARSAVEEGLAGFRAEGEKRQRAIALNALGVVLQNLGEAAEATARFEEALSIVRRIGDARLEAYVLGNLALVELDLGRTESARTRVERALSIAQRLTDRELEGSLTGQLASLLHRALGALDEARPLYERALALFREVGALRFEGVARSSLAWLSADEGRPAAAREEFAHALAILDEAGDARSAAVNRGFVAWLEAEAGHPDDARRALEAGEAALPPGDEVYAAVLGVVRARLELAEAGAARTGGDAPAAQRYEAAAKERRDAAAPAAKRSADVRFVLEKLDRAFEAHRGAVRAPAGPAPAPATAASVAPGFGAVLVQRDGAWVRLPGKKRTVAVGERPTLRRIVARLAEERLARPGRALPVEELLAAGWPGEKVDPLAGANRVYVALATLRKLGLKALIVKGEGGYLLDPAVPLAFTDDPDPG